MKRNVKTKNLIIVGVIYLSFLTTMLTFNFMSSIARTDVADMGLTGLTVNQAEKKLESEGYKKDDYLLITSDGTKPGKAWKIAQVEDARKARLFVADHNKKPIKEMNIIGKNWGTAYEMLINEGYENGTHYTTTSDGAIWGKNLWYVKKIDEETNNGKLINIQLEQIEETDQKIPANFEELAAKTKGMNLSEAIELLKKENIDRKYYTFKSADEKETVILTGNWQVKSVKVSEGKIIMDVIREQPTG